MGISKIYCFLVLVLSLSAATIGCNSGQPISGEDAHQHMESAHSGDEMDAEITAALAELSDDERVAAEAQKFCAVEPENRLGSMGAPIKVMIEGREVFLCCDGCKDAALKDPKATLASVAKLKATNSPGK